MRARLGDPLDDLRDDVTDREGGRNRNPRLAANELAQIETSDLVLNVLLRRVVTVSDRLAGFVRRLAALIDRTVYGRICGFLMSHRQYLFCSRVLVVAEYLITQEFSHFAVLPARWNSQSKKLAGTEGGGSLPGCPPFHQSPGGGSRVAAGGEAAGSRLGANRREMAIVGRVDLLSCFIACE